MTQTEYNGHMDRYLDSIDDRIVRLEAVGSKLEVASEVLKSRIDSVPLRPCPEVVAVTKVVGDHLKEHKEKEEQTKKTLVSVVLKMAGLIVSTVGLSKLIEVLTGK